MRYESRREWTSEGGPNARSALRSVQVVSDGVRSRYLRRCALLCIYRVGAFPIRVVPRIFFLQKILAPDAVIFGGIRGFLYFSI